jgi:GDP/UDP-N,N'-diacetylbacillosamine 2-epimerase (hydrolysing)
MSRKICIVTGSRAEYGLLRLVMDGIRETTGFELQVIATGMHLSPEFGLTYKEIEKDGFGIDRKVEMLLSSDTPVGLAKSMGLGLIGFGDVLQQLKPDLMLVLGDRFEIFSAVSAALVARIPVAHLHGGESTEGAFDEAIRHSITKMSHLHFAATEDYRNRIIQLGEDPKYVFNVGATGVDNIKNLKLLDREALEAELSFKFGNRNLLVTFHPVTLENAASSHQFEQLLEALDGLQDTHVIFTQPNADTDGRIIMELIEDYVSRNKGEAIAFSSLGIQKYLSTMKQMDGVVGNSSSGLIEAPSFPVGTVNIGDRQKGRIRARSVIDCEPNSVSIKKAFQKLFSSEFQKELINIENPYGEGGAVKKIMEILKRTDSANLIKKKFHNIKV